MHMICSVQLRCTVLAFAMIRQKSAWNNGKLMAAIIRRIKLAIQTWADRFEFVLVLDALRAHVCGNALDAFSRCGILPLVIPAGLTSILQMLDTHVFSSYKDALRDLYGAARLQYPQGDAPIEAFMQCVKDAIENVISRRDWSRAFSDNGFGEGAASPSVVQALSLGENVDISAEAPSLTQIELCVPRASKVAAAIIWRRFIESSLRSRQHVSPKLSTPTIKNAGKLPSVLGKTRSQTRALRLSVTAAASPTE